MLPYATLCYFVNNKRVMKTINTIYQLLFFYLFATSVKFYLFTSFSTFLGLGRKIKTLIITEGSIR
jgi:hypothetical protein